jgi:hypothetical protein
MNPPTDLTGQQYGNRRVLRTGGSTNGRAFSWVVCLLCNQEERVRNANLLSGKTSKCNGCRLGAIMASAKPKPDPKPTPLGHREGNLTVTGWFPAHGALEDATDLECRCDCDKIVSFPIGRFRSKRPPVDCGCGADLHSHWADIHRRCKNKDDPDYGGRVDKNGNPDPVTVSEAWQHFDTFMLDMGRRPKGMTLDRIDPWGHYEKSNCKWATAAEQARNKRNSRIIFFQGQSMNLVDFAELIGEEPYWVHRILEWATHEICGPINAAELAGYGPIIEPVLHCYTSDVEVEI